MQQCVELVRRMARAARRPPLDVDEAVGVLEDLLHRIAARQDLQELVAEVWVDMASLGTSFGYQPVRVGIVGRGDVAGLARWSYPIHGFVTDLEPHEPLRQVLSAMDRRLRVSIADGDGWECIAQPVLVWRVGESEERTRTRLADIRTAAESVHRHTVLE